jgi:hypothetical protein
VDLLFPDKGKEVFYQGSRQMESTSRRYYEKELGAVMGPSLGFDEAFGYSEPFRRFVQREGIEPQANEIPNTMPSWMPGEDYYTNFRKGDPYTKVDQGFARLPGDGYAALHPELKGINPEDYPDIHKMAILADIAPYSREYNTFRQTRSPHPAAHKILRTRVRRRPLAHSQHSGAFWVGSSRSRCCSVVSLTCSVSPSWRTQKPLAHARAGEPPSVSR